ncbi:hypothetical protein LSH36_3g27008 [Paralvinella palmiformis]|uniref:INO80 complex subunit B-like conserved region domain-containing protein n=1 Tax=Paralvinella palmiformis TaxID=53620 RepID=A0AAD9KG14_9ANNE|nr:hypothetical protein LSH36_3g27008 [Paralvinella palmiformis]
MAAEEGDEDVDVISTGQPTIKLKIKLGNEAAKKKKVDIADNGAVNDDKIIWEEGKVKGEDIFPTKKAGDDTSDEEREWLDALEAGTLDDSGSVKKNLDESLLTSRQKQTLDRLLKKQEIKLKGSRMRINKRSQAPCLRYISNSEGCFISVPQAAQFPFAKEVSEEPPKLIICGVDGCKNKKKYNCSKTGVPLCSLECYKLNLKNIRKQNM